MSDKEKIEARLAEIEKEMNSPDFWNDKDEAQKTIAEYNDLKDELSGVGKYDKGPAVLSILAGAGGADAEDFARLLLEMYLKYVSSKGWGVSTVHANENDHGGYRNISVEISGKGVYGTLKNESGVHRLVRISPFNANQKRHTSFALVEVIPKLPEMGEIEIPESDIDVEFSKSSGPGGQNVNKRETAVRVIHKPTGIAVHAQSERSQENNRQKALEILRGKLYHMREEERRKKERGLSVGSSTSIEWGNQIRSYVLHPYQMVKDHRTDVEVRDIGKVLEGDLEKFIEAEREL